MAILRKIFKAGNSSVVSIPYYMLELLELQDGNNVYVDRLFDESGKVIGITIKPFLEEK